MPVILINHLTTIADRTQGRISLDLAFAEDITKQYTQPSPKVAIKIADSAGLKGSHSADDAMVAIKHNSKPIS